MGLEGVRQESWPLAAVIRKDVLLLPLFFFFLNEKTKLAETHSEFCSVGSMKSALDKLFWLCPARSFMGQSPN